MSSCQPRRIPTSAQARGRTWIRAGALAGCLGLAAPLLAAPERLSVEDVLQTVNAYRGRHGLVPLRADPTLQAIAQAHSSAMAQQGRLSHAGFQDRMSATPGDLCVENLAAGYRRADALLAGWQVSPAHHANLLEGRVQWAGVASVSGYITLLACRFPGPDDLSSTAPGQIRAR